MVLVFPSADLFKDSKLFPLFPQSPRKLFFYGSHGFRKRKQRKIRDVLLGGQDSFVIPVGTDFTHFWSCFFFSLEDMLFQTFIFRSTRPWLGSMRSLLSLLNHWFCCKFTFLAYLLFSQKNEFECAEVQNRKIFIKSCPICPRTSFLISLDKSYLVQPLRIVGIYVVLCVYFVTLSILLFLSLVLFCISPKNIVPFIFEVRFRLSRLDFSGYFFCESEKRRLLLVHKNLLDRSAGLADDRVCGFCGEVFELNTWILKKR